MLSTSSIVFAVTALAAAVSAHPLAHAHGDHEHVEGRALPGKWYQERDHPAHNLFNRQLNGISTASTGTTSTGAGTTSVAHGTTSAGHGATTVIGHGTASASGTTSSTSTATAASTSQSAGPAVGSAEWKAQYPTPLQPPPQDSLPTAWVNAYKAAVSNGLIPAIPPTTVVTDENYDSNPVYADGYDPSSATVCSSYWQCYNATDYYQGKDGTVAISFDDGPADGSQVLYDFLQSNHIQATHFLIGSNIVDNPDLFLQAFRMNGDLAVHTWTHPFMSAQTDLGVVAEIGWTMQVIYDSTGGRVPRFWRPPYGDMDQRVRAIAEHVFGLTACLWNHDTNDWAMPTGQTAAAIATDVTTWFSGAKSPGLMVLEHELTNDTANVFINTTWPAVTKYGWHAQSIAQMYGTNGYAYANAKGDLDAVTPGATVVTSQTVTGHSALPSWYSGTASTSTSYSSTTITSGASTSSPNAGAGGAAGSSDSNSRSTSTTIVTVGGGDADASSGSGSNSGGGGSNGAALTRPQLSLSAAAVLLALVMFA